MRPAGGLVRGWRGGERETGDGSVRHTDSVTCLSKSPYNLPSASGLSNQIQRFKSELFFYSNSAKDRSSDIFIKQVIQQLIK
jgi:hypothetical protein